VVTLHHGEVTGWRLGSLKYHHNHDVGKIIVIVSFMGINAQNFEDLREFVNYFIFM
jgi:hypothetical protein